ncbi:CYTH and CHAD domain-containing protein [Rhodococcus jostii]|uniref:CYTH and CHAD domain-containing protein n=1 Tax=Rhodococcus jostii TaxID=132919 RepID=A0ABU4CAJ9_RHOJO|nr:CYTH and CHAD domain-containing protein [Rhodococcus jostii]MDV6280565.1 CYTH and CHAD domain-containing protein [Rhodococcus jostii]
MSKAQQEREDKYDVGADFAVPDLDDLVPPGGRLEEDTVTLDSEYFDTADRDLLRQRVTLRRRTGDTDAGWQLKVPDRKARTEIRVPLTADDTVPGELAALVSGVALGKPVHPVASISTVRLRLRMLDPDGNLLTEVADDTVRATAAAAAAGDGAVASEWREVEVELGERGDGKLLEAIGERLTREGARPSRYPSKLSRALNPNGPGLTDNDSAADGSGAEVVRELLTAYLDTQVQAIVGGDVWLRRGLDPVHATRVGIRRFRSTLRVFKKVLDPAARTRLDEELSWYAGVLGEVRDRQVQRARFAAAVTDLPEELVLGPVAARIENDLLAEQLRYRAEVMETVDGDRYRNLLAELARWRTDPPMTENATSGTRALKKAARKARRKADRRLAAALDDGDDVALHRARKAAKRARYAGELTRGLVGKKTSKKRIAEYKKIQKVLGEHQDSVVALGTLRDLGARAGSTGGENGFTFGLLYGLELQAARRARDDAARLTT